MTETRQKGISVLPVLLVAYLSFVLYLYLASWLAYLKAAYLPLSSIPSGSILPLVLVGVVAVTLYNSWKKKKLKNESDSSAKKM